MITIFIADDHAVLRAGLRMLIENETDMQVVGEAENGEKTLGALESLEPQVLLLDLWMPGMGGVKVIESLLKKQAKLRVLVLTMHEDVSYVRSVLAAGGAGYVVKSANDTELLEAIRTVARGRTYVDRSLSEAVEEQVVEKEASTQGSASALDALSPREREVLEFLIYGYTNRNIADELSLSVKSVETYRSRLTQKLGLKSRVDLVRFALEMGLLSNSKGLPPDFDPK